MKYYQNLAFDHCVFKDLNTVSEPAVNRTNIAGMDINVTSGFYLKFTNWTFTSGGLYPGKLDIIRVFGRLDFVIATVCTMIGTLMGIAIGRGIWH